MQETEKVRLIKRAQDGDSSAFEKLVRENKVYITHIAYTTLKDRNDAEDAMQEALLSMYKDIDKLRNVNSFNTWMYQIVYNSCLAVAKKARKGTKASKPIEEVEGDVITEKRIDFLPSKSSEQKELNQILFEKVEELPEKYRVPLSLFYYEDMQYKDIAEIMGASIQDVSNWIHRAKLKLKESMEKDEGAMSFQRPAAVDGAAISAAIAFGAEKISEDDQGALVEGALAHLQEAIAVGISTIGAGTGAVISTGAGAGAVAGAGTAAKVGAAAIAGTAVAAGAGIAADSNRNTLLATVLAGAGIVIAAIGIVVFISSSFSSPIEIAEGEIPSKESSVLSSEEGSDDPTNALAEESADEGGVVENTTDVWVGGDDFRIDNTVTYSVDGITDDPTKDDPDPVLSGESNVVTTVNKSSNTTINAKTGDIIALGALIALAIVSCITLALSWLGRTKRNKRG